MCPPKLLEQLRNPGFYQSASDRSGGAGSAGGSATRTLQYSHLIDLTQTLTPQTPMFPGFPPFQIEPHATHEANGFAVEKISLGDHSGTHIDAPYHCSANGFFVDQVPTEQLVVPAIVIDISEKAQREHAALVTPDDLHSWEQRHGRIPNNAAVLMNSGWGPRFTTPDVFINADASGVPQFPGFGLEAVQWLLAERNISGLGVDSLSLDHGPSPNFAVHFAFLPTNRWGLENLANLDQLPPTGATLFVGATKIGGASGSPTRVLAIW